MVEQIGPFTVLEEIGQGDFGRVYKVRNELGAVRALKVAQDGYDISGEAQATARLNHSGIIAVHGYHENISGIEMEYMGGGSLADKLSGGRLDYDEAIRVATKLLKTLKHAKNKGVAHDGIKPTNILFSGKKVKLSGFGLSDLVDQKVSDDDLSNLDYLSPERAAGQTDPRSEVYSMGLILYEMLVGGLPSGAFPEKPSELYGKGCPQAMDEICKKALSPMDHRFGLEEMMESVANLDKNFVSRLWRKGTKSIPGIIEKIKDSNEFGLIYDIKQNKGWSALGAGLLAFTAGMLLAPGYVASTVAGGLTGSATLAGGHRLINSEGYNNDLLWGSLLLGLLGGALGGAIGHTITPADWNFPAIAEGVMGGALGSVFLQMPLSLLITKK